MNQILRNRSGWWLFAAFAVVTVAVYWSGFSGSWFFDDNPNIVDNPGVHIHDVSLASLTRAALSSPSSKFKRPLASLTFAFNYLGSGLNPYWWKVTNVGIHLINGVLMFLLARMLLALGLPVFPRKRAAGRAPWPPGKTHPDAFHIGIVAALIAGGWMLLPINLTAVLYVVQRMESMANACVLVGLIGYVVFRRRMLADAGGYWRHFSGCVASLVVPLAVGFTAKETAVMLPLYAFLIEWVLFGFAPAPGRRGRDKALIGLYVIVLLAPLVGGLLWRVPRLFRANPWPTRDFTPLTRLMSEARIVLDYIQWTLVPRPDPLSFYHDNYVVSSGLLSPWTTLPSILGIAALLVFAIWLRKRAPLVSLGLLLFFGCQSLTATILPLELIYEHRNYFASFGLLLALIPILAAGARRVHERVAGAGGRAGTGATTAEETGIARAGARLRGETAEPTPDTGATAAPRRGLPLPVARYALLIGLMLLWIVQTAITAYAWGNPLRLAETLAARAPDSPRAEYELGRTYLIRSHYDPDSVYTRLAYGPLERAAKLPKSSILPQQALIFMNSRMHLPIKPQWWDSMIASLKARDPGVQDESSLSALTQCAREGGCKLSKKRMVEAFNAALDHPHPSARIYATYGDYAWNVLDDHTLGRRMIAKAVKAKPDEPAYRITYTRMLAAQGRYRQARAQIDALRRLNYGGRLDGSIAGLEKLLP